ncbi:MAG: caspase family protein, partial [Planctomycetota bacterium]
MARLLIALLVLAAATRAEDHVLLVGCTEYPNLKEQRGYEAFIRLLGPANDVALVRDALVEALGVDKRRITELVGDAPTRKNILAQLDRLARDAKRGDRVIVLLAGHGSQMPDQSGDEPDGLDEIFLPCDVKRWNRTKGAVENAITDDEIAQRVRAIRDAGADVWLLMDCCHTGTMVRGAEAYERSRQLSPDVLGVPEQRSRGGAAAKTPLDDLSGVAALYAAPSYRVTPEMKLPRGSPDRQWHGLFSFTLAKQLRRTGGNLTFRQLHAQMVASYQALPYHGTIPVAEGDLDRTLKGAADGRPPLWVRWDKDRLVLNAGTI